MLKYLKLILCTLFLAPLYSFATTHAASINYQTEAGFKITEAAARAVLNRNDFKEKARNDFYVDIYDGQSFVLSDSRFKLRLKVSDNKPTVQANTKTTILGSQCPQGWEYDVLVKKIGELKINEQMKQHFEQAVTSQLDLIATGSPSDVKRSVLEFDQFVKGLEVPLLENLMSVPHHSNWYFVAGYQAEKKKWVSKLKFDKHEIEVSVAEVRQYVGSTYIDGNFEIEFQFENTDDITISNFQSVVCSYLKQNGFKDGDFATEGLDPQLETLRRLKRFNSTLGL
ncbi:hypothetical protein K2P97_10185 [bacterium]|nr:hypothetical protein [bacterium]